MHARKWFQKNFISLRKTPAFKKKTYTLISLDHWTYEETYLSVPPPLPDNEFKTILSYRDHGVYHRYECLSCSRLSLKKRENQTFPFL
jgi:hypothetical protein